MEFDNDVNDLRNSGKKSKEEIKIPEDPFQRICGSRNAFRKVNIGNNISQLPTLLATLSIEIEENKFEKVNVYEGDSIEQLAQNLITKFHLKGNLLKPLIEGLKSKLNKVINNNQNTHCENINDEDLDINEYKNEHKNCIKQSIGKTSKLKKINDSLHPRFNYQGANDANTCVNKINSKNEKDYNENFYQNKQFTSDTNKYRNNYKNGKLIESENYYDNCIEKGNQIREKLDQKENTNNFSKIESIPKNYLIEKMNNEMNSEIIIDKIELDKNLKAKCINIKNNNINKDNKDYKYNENKESHLLNKNTNYERKRKKSDNKESSKACKVSKF